jgi:endonuclease-3
MPKTPLTPKPSRTAKSSSKPSASASGVGVLPPAALDSPTMGRILETLANCYKIHPMGELTRRDPYKVLVACVLSLRTKDEVTIPASERLFAVADTPQKMVTLTPDTIEKLIFPAGFYKTKARTIIEFSQQLLDELNGRVPDTIDALLRFKGVGRKTANLVVGLGYGLPAICVDTHVHRICNRLNYVKTKTPEETERVLREKLPPQYWNTINTVLVLHGQQTCKPIGARCDVCPVEPLCAKIDTKPRAIKK